MIFVGNFKSWISDTWIEEILNTRGTARPAEGKRPDSPEENAEYAKARNAGYKDDNTFFYMFDKHNTNFDIIPPFIEGKFHWWITKMLPGNFMPVHTDPHTQYQKNSKRYWMPWQDYHPGHLFLYKDTVITNYKAGDVYVYADSSAIHGAANIGHLPRIVLQISTYDQ
jgi:hypothetical protein